MSKKKGNKSNTRENTHGGKLPIRKSSRKQDVVSVIALVVLLGTTVLGGIITIFDAPVNNIGDAENSQLENSLRNLGLTDQQIASMLGKEYATPANAFTINTTGFTDEEIESIEDSIAESENAKYNNELYVGRKVIVPHDAKVGDKIELDTYDDYISYDENVDDEYLYNESDVQESAADYEIFDADDLNIE